MSIFLKTIVVFCLLAAAGRLHAQDNNKDAAKTKGQQAIVLMDDQGKYEEAIKLLEEAQKLDPEHIAYPYEIAYAHNARGDYKKASLILERLIAHPQAHARVYQLLGNTYNAMGKPDKAIAAYETGLRNFPDAGRLYMELGNMNITRKSYNKALAYYERGIKADPGFPSNYYWAARLYCNSPEEIWGMIYGEIFMNMERSTTRTEEISRLLYQTYKNGIRLHGSAEATVDLSESAADTLQGATGLKAPFPRAVYIPLLKAALRGEQDIGLATLNRVRTRFLEAYFRIGSNESHPNILFDFQRTVKEAGHLEAYNYWVLKKGDDETFNRWKVNNEEKWSRFMNWFGQNKLTVDKEHNFHREQY